MLKSGCSWRTLKPENGLVTWEGIYYTLRKVVLRFFVGAPLQYNYKIIKLQREKRNKNHQNRNKRQNKQ